MLKIFVRSFAIALATVLTAMPSVEPAPTAINYAGVTLTLDQGETPHQAVEIINGTFAACRQDMITNGEVRRSFSRVSGFDWCMYHHLGQSLVAIDQGHVASMHATFWQEDNAQAFELCERYVEKSVDDSETTEDANQSLTFSLDATFDLRTDDSKFGKCIKAEMANN